jgi:two-component system response regulator MprA
VVVLPTDDVRMRVAALDAGADDSLPSPAEWGELVARTEAIRRRRAGRGRDVLRAFDVELDVRRSQARRAGRPLELTELETRLLEFFLRNPRQLLLRRLIVSRVWGDDAGVRENALEVYVGYLRRKLEAAGEPRLIQTVRGDGYAFAPAWPATD